MGSRAAESSAPHSAKAGRGYSEMEGGGRSEGTGWSDNVQEVREVRRGKVMDRLVGVQKDFVGDSLIKREPMELLEDGGDVVG